MAHATHGRFDSNPELISRGGHLFGDQRGRHEGQSHSRRQGQHNALLDLRESCNRRPNPNPNVSSFVNENSARMWGTSDFEGVSGEAVGELVEQGRAGSLGLNSDDVPRATDSM